MDGHVEGTDYPIDVAESALVSRGMRALAMLLRHPDVKISNYLLEGLDRRPGHGRQTDDDTKRKRDILQRQIDPLSRMVFDQIIDVDEAHAELLRVIDPPETRSGYSKFATWSNQHDFTAKARHSEEDKEWGERP